MKKKLQTEIDKLAGLLKTPRKILLITHINPDGDAIGSTMALYHFLKKTGHDVIAMVPNSFPDFLSWIKDSKEMIIFQNNTKAGKKAIEDAEIIFCVDFNDFKRLKDIGPLLEASSAINVLIDHHPMPPDVYACNVHDTSVSATAELVYHYICGAGQRTQIDPTIAECIYCGIMTDTGCFSYNSSNPSTFQAVADLLTVGFDKDLVFDNVFNNFSEHRMKLMGFCLNEKMVVLPHLHAAYISLTAEEMERYKFNTGDTEGFVNLPFSIKGINITALFTEKKDVIRISMRSRGSFAINEICQEHFTGGGHKNAAGGESNQNLADTIAIFEKAILKRKDEINKIYNSHS